MQQDENEIKSAFPPLSVLNYLDNKGFVRP